MKRDPFFFFLISLVIQKQEAPSILYCVEERYKARAISSQQVNGWQKILIPVYLLNSQFGRKCTFSRVKQCKCHSWTRKMFVLHTDQFKCTLIFIEIKVLKVTFLQFVIS